MLFSSSLSFNPRTISFCGFTHTRDAEQFITIKNNEEAKSIVVKLTAIPGKNFLYRLAPDIVYLKPNEELVVKITRDHLITGTFEGEWRDVLGVEATETRLWDTAQSQEELATKDAKEQWRVFTKDGRHIESFLVPIYHKEPETPEIIDNPDDPNDSLVFPNWDDLEKPGNWFRFHLSGKEETEAHFSAAFWEPLEGGQPQKCVVRLRNDEELHPGSMTVRWVMGYKSGATVLDFSPRSAIARALHEVRIWRELKHDNIAPLYGTILWPMMGLMSPSYRNGTVLPFVVDKKPPWEMRVSLMKDIASALAYIHSKCIIHGDLTETNVAIDHNHRPILNNFELSTTEEDAKEGPLPWANYRYLAPEVPWSGWRKTTQSDVYAYGVLILEIATGRLARRELEEAVDLTTTNDSWSDRDYFPDLPPDYYQELRRNSSNVLWGVIRKCTKIFIDRPPMEKNILPSLDDITGGDWVPQDLTG